MVRAEEKAMTLAAEARFDSWRGTARYRPHASETDRPERERELMGRAIQEGMLRRKARHSKG